ncbi:hypothetical protein Q9L58_000267 [Maublancomyces gigas]|uniref:Uncharacterized protein n=1 Tax=Discina gigas TaxID=1032678 RepID=A0ABR3GXC5_9PEZI
MSFLMMVLVGTIAGTGLAIVRLFISWCTCGDDDKNIDPNRRPPGTRHDDYLVNSGGPLDSWLVLPVETEDRTGGKHARRVDGNHKSDDPKDLVDNGALNKSQFLLPDELPSSREQREKKIDSKPLFGDGGTPNDRFQEETNGRDRLITTGESVEDTVHRVPVTDGLDDAVHRIFPVSKLTTPEMPAPSRIFSRTMLQGLPVNSHTGIPKDRQSEEVTGSLTSEKPQIRNFHGSGKRVSDPPKLFSAEKLPTATSRVRYHERRKRGEDGIKFSAPVYKADNAGGFRIQIPAPDTHKNFRSLNNTSQTTAPVSRTFRRISNDELTKKNVLPVSFNFQAAKDPLVSIVGKPGGKKRDLRFANIPRPLGYTPYTSSGEPRATFAPEIAVAAAENKKADKGGDQRDVFNQIPFDLASLNTNPCRNLAGTVSLKREGVNPVKIEKVSGPIAKKLSAKGPFLVSVPTLTSVEFTSNSRSFERTGGIETTQSSVGDTGTKVSGPTGLMEGLPLPVSRTRLISTPRPRKANTPPALNFTPGRKFRNPSHFPQTLPIFQGAPGNQPKTTKIFESTAKETADFLNGQKRVLQDGSLKKPLVGRVKLVSKIDGKDPRFTYTTWAKAGSKRSRGAHNCQQAGGCRGCD